jgi:putative flippase GtrA
VRYQGTRRAKGEYRWVRSPALSAQGLRFGVVGVVVGLVYLGATTLLADVAGVPFQAALAIGFSAAVLMHFTLQRIFVWARHEEFVLPLHHQIGRYMAIAGIQYGVTAASTSTLPSVLGVSTEIVYLVTLAVVTATNFLLFRHRIFHVER